MSLLKKIEGNVNDEDKEILQALNVEKSTEEMLVELQQAGKIKLEANSISNEDQVL